LLTQPSRQVLAVQRALSEFGYGQLKPTGVYDAETKAAVQRFEREHSLPVTDEISEPMKRALATVTGRALD
jgi:peptidoglycan hydrolase-like protein with peptidoglycan-binding domain